MTASTEAISQQDPVLTLSSQDMLNTIVTSLDDHKAEDITSINLAGKSSIADHLVIASGRSQRQVAALSDYVLRALKDKGVKGLHVEGLDQADWVLIDAGDVIVHIFRPEVRSFYNLDKMWTADLTDNETVVN
ncbi:ribosomal silencing factor RsfS [Kordiimonas sediminis]|uniref:Ribosomal silencing factor RsfS n=1 Tax=Kordiimonas sediminis TaxID=1735581 RepID=A0A919AR53_9PROT|nr:ribosome silencing factor [Kordiimonas sediminis]GHF20435.1 ribosomal silencing factor RsfS [Kordiimonas sediminis]